MWTVERLKNTRVKARVICGRENTRRETVLAAAGGGAKKAVKIRPETFDVVVLDPPTLTKTAYGSVDIVNDYQSLAKPAALCVSPGGVLAGSTAVHLTLAPWFFL